MSTIDGNGGIKPVKTSSVSSGAGVGPKAVKGVEAIAAVGQDSSAVNPATNVAGAIFQAALGNHPLASLLATG